VRVLMLNDFRQVGGAESHVDTLKKALEQKGIEVGLWVAEEHVDVSDWRQAIKEFKPDILHVHNWALLIKEKATDGLFDTVPTVLSLHDYLLICYKRMRLHNWKCCPHICADACDLYSKAKELQKIAEPAVKVCFTTGSQDLFLTHGVETTLIPHGLDIGQWPCDFTQKDPIGFVSAHPAYWWKGEAEADQLSAHVGLRFVKAIGTLKTREQMSEFYRSLEVLVLPTIYDEPFCLVITEAMLSGVIVISYRNTGSEFQIKDGETGYLVPKGDCSALEKTVQAAMAKDNTVIKENARQYVIDHFQADRMADDYVALYERILGSK
jgi:glycosyltransferase involved in cell wall biosynthesis